MDIGYYSERCDKEIGCACIYSTPGGGEGPGDMCYKIWG